MLCLYDIAPVLLDASNPTLTIKRFMKSNCHFKTEEYQFQGRGRTPTPVSDGKNVVMLLTRIRLNKEQERDPHDIRGQFISWIVAVLAGDTGIIDTIQANAELVQDPDCDFLPSV
jgi:hypothetical protein